MPGPTELEIIYLIAITHVWARGTLFAWFRSGSILCRDLNSRACKLWRALFDCPLCVGVWVGMVGHVAFLYLPFGDVAVTVLGIGSIVGTGSLTTYGVIRAIPVPAPKKEENRDALP